MLSIPQEAFRALFDAWASEIKGAADIKEAADRATEQKARTKRVEQAAGKQLIRRSFFRCAGLCFALGTVVAVLCAPHALPSALAHVRRAVAVGGRRRPPGAARPAVALQLRQADRMSRLARDIEKILGVVRDRGSSTSL